MKNWLPFVFGPLHGNGELRSTYLVSNNRRRCDLFAIESTPAPVCLRSFVISSANDGLLRDDDEDDRSLVLAVKPIDGRAAGAGASRIAALNHEVL